MINPDFAGNITWAEVADRLAQGAIAILPIGAGAKQHGLHMAMAADQIQAEWFAAELAKTLDAVIWPTVTYGSYPAFTDYAGSISLSGSTFESLVLEIVEGLITFGARKIVILNTGLSTIAPVDCALERVTMPALVRHLKMYSGSRYRQAAASVCQQSQGSHADEMETSILLAIAPQHVNMSLAQNSQVPAGGPTPGPLTPADATSPNYSKSGSFGSPTLASAEKGVVLVEAILADLAEAASSER